MTRAHIGLGALLTCSGIACAAPDPKKIDTDAPLGSINEREARLYFVQQLPELFGKLEAKLRGGNVSAQEWTHVVEAHFDEIGATSDIPAQWGEYQRAAAASNGEVPIKTFERIAGYSKPAPRKKPGAKWTDADGNELSFRLMLRSSYRDLAIAQNDSDKAFKADKGARFTFLHDFRDDDNTWQATGTFLAPLQIVPKDSGRIFEILLVPSLSFDRLGSTDQGTPERNDLIARINAQFGVWRNDQASNQHYFRAGVAYGTDFDLESSVIAAELDWVPVITEIGIGKQIEIFPAASGDAFAEFRWQPEIGLKYGSVLDAADRPNLADDDTFLRLGPHVEGNLWFPAIDRLELSAAYTYMVGLAGEAENMDELSVKATWKLDETGHFAIEAEYRVGESPLMTSDTETLSVGLAVKF